MLYQIPLDPREDRGGERVALQRPLLELSVIVRKSAGTPGMLSPAGSTLSTAGSQGPLEL